MNKELTNNQLSLINQMACDIAELEIELHFKGATIRVYKTDACDETVYTEEAQEVFDTFYDHWTDELTKLVQSE
jgi:hypothetical protein